VRSSLRAPRRLLEVFEFTSKSVPGDSTRQQICTRRLDAIIQSTMFLSPAAVEQIWHIHTEDYDPFIKSQLASTQLT